MKGVRRVKDNLLPCPFCGKIPEVYTARKGTYNGLTRVFHRCEILGYIEIQGWDDGVTCADRWNKRTPII